MARTALILVLVLSSCAAPDGNTDWRYFGGDLANSQYSTLDQIDRTNVGRLDVAWTYHTGDADSSNRSQIQFNPIVVDGVLYGASPRLKLFALDAATGAEKWVFDLYAAGDAPSVFGVSRGVAYWESGDDRRLLYGAGHRLFALDARTGLPIPSFGSGGFVDLREGLDRDAAGTFWSLNTPGVVYQDLYIVGGRVAEELPSAPGHIRAYDIRTGERAWIFHTIPQPGEYGYNSWPADAWQRTGGVNVWSGMSLDPERGTVYLPTGSAAFDFWGGNRHGENLFANAILALDAATGERKWHYQTVRHDIWDRDLPAAPNLVTVTHDGRRIDALAQITKSGHVWLLDRDTGAPLFPVEERQVLPSDLDGEAAWPTQALPTRPPPFARQQLGPDDINDLFPEQAAVFRDSLARLRSAGQFVPPSTQGTIIFPGFDGGGEWGGAAHDPNAGILYVNANEMPWVLQMRKIDLDASQRSFSAGQQLFAYYCYNCHGAGASDATGIPSLAGIGQRKTREQVAAQVRGGGVRMPALPYLKPDEVDAIVAFLFGDPQPEGLTASPEAAVRYNHMGYNRFVDANGYPVVRPPWGTLNAIDLNRGEILWSVPLGEIPELTARGIPKTGTENYGGPIATAGGLLFIGASKDERFRAFDRATGEELWSTRLPSGGYATPATYAVNGRQYVVIAAGGGKMGTRSGDAYVAFALPR
ncbi:MAG: PQQ-binding-like beta-propeller repeat protein [Rhodothermales bacterium]